jgi:16S rRNA (guanine(966)-N(2))-methyltransferase RsmD
MTKPQHHHKSRPPQQVRIIGGQWKRTPLPVPTATDLRPTPDRVRETAFNWLQHLRGDSWSKCSVLDLFAGSGALGLEAASRGAGKVLLVDSVSHVVAQLEHIKTRLNAPQLTIKRADALLLAQQLIGTGQRFDLIFLDPPYAGPWLEKLLPLCHRLLQPGGLLYAEAGSALSDGDAAPLHMAGWEIVRQDQAGMVFYHILQAAPGQP